MPPKTRSPLSTIQEYRGIVHMMPYGSLNGPAGHMWMLFYRCATCFELDITMSDIEGTPFAAKLAPHMVEPTTIEESRKYLRTVGANKALVIDHIFSTLDELAPHHAREWTTLEDVLTTPRYRLSLHKPEHDNSNNDAVARVDSGPITTPALGLLQARFDVPSLHIDPDILDSLLQMPASNITFPEPIDSNTVPREVLIPASDATTSTSAPVTILPCGRTTRNMDADRTTNPSHFAIRTYIELHRHLSAQSPSFRSAICVQELLAVVTTETPPPDTARDKYDAKGLEQSAGTESPAPYLYKNAQTQNATYLAGIILKPTLPGAKPLSDPATIARAVADPSLRHKWRSALLSTVQFLHSCVPQLYHGSISPRVILVGPGNTGGEGLGGETEGDEKESRTGQLFLTGFTDNQLNLMYIPHSDHWTPAGDLAALENIFGDDGWLLAELKKAKGEVEKDYGWKRDGFEADQAAVQKSKEASRDLERARKEKSA